LIYGGFKLETETSTSSGLEIDIRENLDDLWVLSLYSKKWHQVYVNSFENPSEREESKMVTVSLERLALMFGGFYSNEIYDETWYYNLFTNMWQKMDVSIDPSTSNSAIPPGLKGHSLVSSEFGIVLYGGETWFEADFDVTDANYEERSTYLSSCEIIIKAEGLSVDDIGTTAFEDAYAR